MEKLIDSMPTGLIEYISIVIVVSVITTLIVDKLLELILN